MSLKYSTFSPWYIWERSHLVLNNNHSRTYSLWFPHYYTISDDKKINTFYLKQLIIMVIKVMSVYSIHHLSYTYKMLIQIFYYFHSILFSGMVSHSIIKKTSFLNINECECSTCIPLYKRQLFPIMSVYCIYIFVCTISRSRFGLKTGPSISNRSIVH